MEKNIFSNALSNFSFDMAARGAIRHLYDSGLTPSEIAGSLSYPVDISRIEKEIEEYESEMHSPGSGYEYIKQTDPYGRSSFVRVKRNPAD